MFINNLPCNVHSPFQDQDPEPLQLDYCDFIGCYVPSRPDTALIVSANSIELPEDPKRLPNSKDYFSKFFSSTVERAKNELSNRAATLRRSKRNPPSKVDGSKRSSWNSNYSSNILLTDPTPVAMDRPITPANIPNPNQRRDDDASDRSSSTKSSQLTNASTSTTNSIRSTASGSRKKSLGAASTLKPTTILSLEDRDLVIIDGNDIKESVQNESEVIVVDNPRAVQSQAAASNIAGEVDLMDILGKDWPTAAGDTAHVLNSAERRGNGQVLKPNLGELTPRNKSINIISHLKNTKGNSLPRNSGNNNGYFGGSANTSTESSHSDSTFKKSKCDSPGGDIWTRFDI